MLMIQRGLRQRSLHRPHSIPNESKMLSFLWPEPYTERSINIHKMEGRCLTCFLPAFQHRQHGPCRFNTILLTKNSYKITTRQPAILPIFWKYKMLSGRII